MLFLTIHDDVHVRAEASRISAAGVGAREIIEEELLTTIRGRSTQADAGLQAPASVPWPIGGKVISADTKRLPVLCRLE